MSEDTLANEVSQALSDLLAPARELDARLEARETELTNELELVRGQRRRMRATLKALDRQNVAPKKPGPTPRKIDGPGKYVSEQKLNEISQILNDKAEEINANGGMNRTQLFAISGNPQSAKTTFMYACRVLHANGFLKLDHVERARGGPQNFYKVA